MCSFHGWSSSSFIASRKARRLDHLPLYHRLHFLHFQHIIHMFNKFQDIICYSSCLVDKNWPKVCLNCKKNPAFVKWWLCKLTWDYFFMRKTGTMGCLTLASGGWIANLIVYLIEEFNIKSISAAKIYNFVNGSITMFPIVGAVLADSYVGCFSVIWFSSLISLLVLSLSHLIKTYIF